MADEIVWNIAGQQLVDALKQENIEAEEVLFNGESSEEEMFRIKKLAKEAGATIVIGVGGMTTIAALAIVETCEDTLIKYAHLAYESNKAKVVTPALEAVVEANTLLSGLGFESGGLAAAHSVHNGFTAVDGEIHSLTHSEKVAFGTLVQLALEERTLDEI